jgi:uncharacterized protein (TIGR01777 family)
MKIVILGGSGLIGQALSQHLQPKYTVVTHDRKIFDSSSNLMNAILGSDVVINLAGANIGERWTKGYKQQIWDSRIKSTQSLVDCLHKIEEPSHRPQRLINASAIGFYPQSNCQFTFDESQTEPGNDFLAKLSVAWETEAMKAESICPVTITRFGVVLAKQGGALAKMLPAFKMGMGGPVAGGNQCFSWITIDDLCKAVHFILQRPNLSGAINVTSPHPLPQKQFAQALGRALNRPAVIPLFSWQLKLIFGEGAQVLTHSASVFPKRLLDEGFEFGFPEVSQALKQVLLD